MADQIAGYPTSGLERFVGGFEAGYEKMTDIRKKADDLKMQIASNAKLRETAASAAANAKSGSDGSTTTRESAYDTGDTTGSGGGSGGGGGGGRGGSGEGGWGDYASPIVDFYKKAGYTDAAIQGIMANGLAEGGFKTNWLPGDNGSSFGHWQFHRGGELDGYERWARANNVTNLQDSLNQARYVDYRMNQIDPNFKNLTDAKAATNQFHIGFEKPKDQTPGLRFGHLATAQRYLAGGGAPAPAGPAGLSAGSSAPVPGAPVQVGGPGSEGYGTSAPSSAAPAALSLAPLPNTSLGSSGLGTPRMTGRPQQMSELPQPQQQVAALGGPPQGAPPPDVYNRPQAPQPPSVLAQLAGQQYLPQPNAALIPNNLYGGLA